MNRVTKALVTTAAVVGVAAGGFGVANATTSTGPEADASTETDSAVEAVESSESSDYSEDEMPITGDALDQASAAALAETGGGEVTETEIDDEESYYEVEVTLDDGSEVDVQLDENFNVIGVEDDSDDDDEDDEDEDDDSEDDDEDEDGAAG